MAGIETVLLQRLHPAACRLTAGVGVFAAVAVVTTREIGVNAVALTAWASRASTWGFSWVGYAGGWNCVVHSSLANHSKE